MGVKATRRLQALWAVRSDDWWRVWRRCNLEWWKGLGIRKSDVDASDEDAPEQRPLLDRE